MERADRNAADPVTPEDGAELARSVGEWGTRGSFFALVEALERRLGGGALGTEARPADERIRFRHSPALAFAAGDVARAHVDAEAGVAEIETTFLGTSGAVSVLPIFMLEEIAQEDPDRPLRRELVDLFHHRALSLLFRSVQRLRPAAVMRADGSDFWSQRLVAAAGAESSELSMPERLRILPLLATSRRSALGLQEALRILVRRRLESDAIHIEIRELAGDAVPIAETCRTKLGRAAHALGRETVLGGRAPDPTGRCVVVVLGIDAQTHPRFLPGGDVHSLVREVFRLFDPAAIELQLELHVEARGTGFALGRGDALGRRTWLASPRPSRTVRVAA